jgi:ribosome-interacting GTPase 1
MVPYENIQFQLVDTPPITHDYMDPWMGDLMRRCDLLCILADLRGDPIKQIEDILAILGDLRIFPEDHAVPEDLKKPPFMKKMVVLVNKHDDKNADEDYEIFMELWEYSLPCMSISALTGRNLERFVQWVFDLSGIIRVYTKTPGKKSTFNNPFVVPKESTLEELALKIHKDFYDNLKFARIWGKAVFDGQMVQREHVLKDGDIVEIHT